MKKDRAAGNLPKSAPDRSTGKSRRPLNSLEVKTIPAAELEAACVGKESP